jgi:myo-inositol 2-dehydrogenase/D-chiro-inositol 1-dehydrogenase
MSELDLTRRNFMGAAAVAGAGMLLAGCSTRKAVEPTKFLNEAPDGEPIKAGLVGCGGRGTGAVQNFLRAGKNLEIVALADLFQDKLDACRRRFEGRPEAKLTDETCFTGFDAYQKLLQVPGLNYVILATPPYFRPQHFEAAVEANKNVFMEKPVAVDPVGARQIMASGEKAKAYKLSIVAGTQRRHQRQYIETYNHVKNGAIGEIVAARAYWCQGQLWYKEPQKDWSQMEAMIRDWVNWCWLSGDHIVEQHVHNIDVCNWFVGAFPVKASGFGARMRRVTGDQYDFFAVDFTYENGVHMASYCRQIDGCWNSVSEYIEGTEGSTDCKGTIYDKKGNVVWQYQEEDPKEPGKKMEPERSAMDPYVQEHIDLVTAIRTGQPLNEAETVAKSVLTAIMGRISAYTGPETTWDQMMSSDLKLGPAEMVMGPVPGITAQVPIPGTSKEGTSTSQE